MGDGDFSDSADGGMESFDDSASGGGDQAGADPVAGTASGDATYSGTSDGGGVVVGHFPDGTTMTVPSWGGEQAHIWKEGQDPSGRLRSVVDRQGNLVAWDTQTGQVTTAIHEQQGVYTVSEDLPSFDES